MTYSNLYKAVSDMSRKLHSFDGHHISPGASVRCFTTLARGLDYLNREPAAVAVNYDAEILVDGKLLAVTVELKGTKIEAPCECSIKIR